MSTVVRKRMNMMTIYYDTCKSGSGGQMTNGGEMGEEQLWRAGEVVENPREGHGIQGHHGEYLLFWVLLPKFCLKFPQIAGPKLLQIWGAKNPLRGTAF